MDFDLTQQIKRTCQRLGLNDDGTCLKSRVRFVTDYCSGRIDFEYLGRDAPFIAQQLQYSGLEDLQALRRVMSYAWSSRQEEE